MALLLPSARRVACGGAAEALVATRTRGRHDIGLARRTTESNSPRLHLLGAPPLGGGGARPRRPLLLSSPFSSFATPDELQRYLREQRDGEEAASSSPGPGGAPSHQRVWRALAPTAAEGQEPASEDSGGGTGDAEGPAAAGVERSTWRERVADRQTTSLSDILQRISAQESRGGRLRLRQHGVLHDDPATDMEMLTQNYTVTALASALRDREDSLQMAAVLAAEERWDELRQMLSVFHPKYVLQRRSEARPLDLTAAASLNPHSLEVIRRALMRMPRTVTQAHSRRAGVVLALCSVEGVPSLLLEKRSASIRAHPDEVCLPGGMVCRMNDRTIIATCLREMGEEIGGLSPRSVQVLGILRCNWGEVHHLVGVAVTPVVCYLGELPDRLVPDHREVAEVFTIPLASLLDRSLWVYKEGLAPIFLGGPHVIWGLTGYILDRFCKDILLPNSRSTADELL